MKVENIAILTDPAKKFLKIAIGTAILLHFVAAAHGDSVAWNASTDVNAGGWGRMFHLQNGHWLLVDTVYPKGSSHLQIFISTNTCRSWSPIASVTQPGRHLDNGELIQITNGTLLLTMRSVLSSNRLNYSYCLPVYQSTNGGTNWALLSSLDTNNVPTGTTTNGLWEPILRILDDGRLAALYSSEKFEPTFNQLISERISIDNGATWGNEFHVVAQVGALRPGMPQMARMANGHYMLAYEIVGIGNAAVYFKTSPDGVTWPAGIGTPIPNQNSGPFLTAFSNGRMFITSSQNAVSCSDDYGATWQEVEPAWNIGFYLSWASIYQTKPDELAVIAGLPSPRSTVSIRFGAVSQAPVNPLQKTGPFGK